MATSTNNLQLTLNQLDSLNTSIINRTIGPISFAGTVGEFVVGSLPSSSQTTITLPTATVFQCYIKNTTTASSSVNNTITVNWTPQGGSTATITVLGPAQAIALWSPSSSSTAGITAMNFVASNAPVYFEAFFGG